MPGLIIFAYCTPLALLYKSTLIAYVATAGIAHCLGFSFFILPFCYCIGWKSEDAMVRTAATSTCMLCAFVAARVFQVEPEVLALFQSPVNVLGAVMLFLCLLIMSNLYYCDAYRGCGGDYLRRNATFMAAASCAMYCGNVYGMQGLSNTATTFFVLWLMEKYCELHISQEWNVWVMVLLLSITMYKLALGLHEYPAFVASLFELNSPEMSVS